MHIGIVLPSVPGYSETFFRNKIRGLQQHGFEVTLFVKNRNNIHDFMCRVVEHPRLHKNPLLRGLQSFMIFGWIAIIARRPTVRLFQNTRKAGYSIMQAIRAVVIARAVLPERLDWLHFGFATPAIEREYIGGAIGAKVAVSFRGFDLNQLPLSSPRVYDKLWLNVSKVHSISKYLIERAQMLGLSCDTPTQIITPAVDANAFKADPSKRKANKLLIVSRLHWIKGIEVVLQAISIARQKTENIELTIAGEGGEHERLVFAAHQLGVKSLVKFVGKQTHEQIVEMMKSHEVFIQYSFQEGFCNAALEAQSSGMLCIVSDAEGLQENVLHEKTGWVVPKRNPELLAEQIVAVLNLPESEKERIRKQARTRVENEFNLELQNQKFVEFYSS